MLIRYLLLAVLTCASALRAAESADATFERLARACIEDLLRASPENATYLGDHRFDGELSDYSPAARAAFVEKLRAHLAALGKIDAAALTGANRVDVQILRHNLEAQLFSLTELKASEWDPLIYNQSLANGIYFLTAREFAPAEVRLRSAAQRLAGLPRVIEQAKANLKNPPRIYTETAIQQTNGAIGLARNGLDPLFAQAPAALKAELAPMQERAVAALTDYKQWLQQELLPRSNGDFRLGPELFRKKLRYTLGSDLSAEEILARAENELVTATEALYATARPLFQKYFPSDTAALDDRSKVIKTVLDKLAEQRPNDDTVVDFAKQVLRSCTDFVRAKDLVTIPDTPLQVIVTPEFRRGRGVAYCDPPGALEPGGQTFVALEPTPADWSAERKASFYREYNNYMLADLMVHEAMPGHFLQLAHANRFKAPTLVRAIFWSGTFAEGWAVYTERVMAEAGFGGPEVRMQQLKMRLRVIVNAILDQKLHMAGLTEREALDLMMKRGFQEEGEAVGKWKRAQLSSTQLSTYFIGAIEQDDLRAAAEAKLGDKFDLKQYHDRVLSYGTAPAKYVQQEMGL